MNRQARENAASKYRPKAIKLLLVAETPPKALDRYFYFEEVREHDSLFRSVAREILGVEPDRANKARLLLQLRERGVFLIDLNLDPVDGTALRALVPDLVRRCLELSPRRVILIKTSVYDAAFADLRDAGLPVVNERIPFPGSGRQKEFREALRRALRDCNAPLQSSN